jgi:hypothetical protein
VIAPACLSDMLEGPSAQLRAGTNRHLRVFATVRA